MWQDDKAGKQIENKYANNLIFAKKRKSSQLRYPGTSTPGYGQTLDNTGSALPREDGDVFCQ